ncbi:hypothetical protein OESDEN_04474 [Oesophagostomum dentatum]|uniref:Uncharacterized protein n=1 Tax=Oesophagostomum dentatum TaxID=61180 RepID=A0A0B1TDF9_OESDE|nr:hypothetical protein OESDEN_04474 [Oesophagostomum dentatum]
MNYCDYFRMSIFLNGSHLSSPEKAQFSSAATLTSSPDTVSNYSTPSAFKTRQAAEDPPEKKSAYSISNILDKKENSPTASSSSAVSDDDTGSPRCGSTEEEHGFVEIGLLMRIKFIARKERRVKNRGIIILCAS